MFHLLYLPSLAHFENSGVILLEGIPPLGGQKNWEVFFLKKEILTFIAQLQKKSVQHLNY